ncbi:hypothetical protein N7449_006539 [Penicillium cf. viridicatum]|uniref:Uncharacterized protein n=1 Tax=Penicillium cf. viridicatum TaxID=2972119 RepID=A0A9W9MB83_9EURO|nr:hypothetical protein N7449_006539 [Penicillium cf. viridicatum]
MFSTTSFAEPKLSELVATLIAKSNFASCSTALKYALDTSGPSSLRDAYRQHTINAPAPASTITNKPTTPNAVIIRNPMVRYNSLFNN